MKNFTNYYSSALLLGASLMLYACNNQTVKPESASHTSALVPGTSYVSRCEKKGMASVGDFVRGYGAGHSVEEAKRQALRDISEKISISVKSENKSLTSQSNGQIETLFESSINTASNVKLDNALQICIDRKDPSGTIHLAYEIDHRPPLAKLASDLRQTLKGRIPETILWKGSDILIKSDAMNELTRHVTVAGEPGLTMQISASLYRKNTQWYLSAGEDRVKLDSADLVKLLNWGQKGNKGVTINVVRNVDNVATLRLQEREEFFFQVNSAINGYGTIFNVYPDGRVAQLLDSFPLTASLRLPKVGVFESVLAEAGKTAIDSYLLICTNAPVNNVTFRQLGVDSGIIKGEESYKLSQFIDWLGKAETLAVLSFQVETTPR